jgi:hypothetical protein
MADAKRCDACGKYSTDAEEMRMSSAADVTEYEGWWSLQSLEWSPGANSRVPLHELDICSRECLGRVADRVRLGHK